MVDLEGSSRPDLPRSQVLRAGSERRRMGRRDAKNRGQMTEGRGWPLPKAGDYCAQRRQDAEASGISLSGYGCEARFVGRLASGVASRATIPCPAVPSPLAPGATCINKPNSRRSRVGRGRRDEGQMCETNPISRLRISDCGLGTDLRRDAPLRPATSGLRGTIMQNEPNSAGATRRASALQRKGYDESGTQKAPAKQSQLPATPGGLGLLYKQTQFLPLCRSGDRRSREDESCKTNPIPGTAGWDRAVGRWENAQNEANFGGGFKCEAAGVRQIVQNEPNLRLAAWHGHLAREFHGRDAHATSTAAAQSEPCKTKPIRRPGGTPTHGRGTRCKCAKRSQLAVGEPLAEIPHYSSIPSFHHSNPVPVVRNKANCSWGPLEVAGCVGYHSEG